jgi:hypothetical protein
MTDCWHRVLCKKTGNRIITCFGGPSLLLTRTFSPVNALVEKIGASCETLPNVSDHLALWGPDRHQASIPMDLAASV